MNIAVIMDKWKGTLTAVEASEDIRYTWNLVRKDDQMLCRPMSDGGEGFGEIIGNSLGGMPVLEDSIDAVGRPRKVTWWSIGEDATGVFETAESNGLALLLPDKVHPFQCDTRGVGIVLEKMLRRGVKKIYLGIGGSATNDGGFGMAQALGYQFLDSQGREIEKWTDLVRLEKIEGPSTEIKELLSGTNITVACDVENPLLGPRGATEIYGPQKGLTDLEDRKKAEANLSQLAKVVKGTFKKDVVRRPGAGAAGGLGFGLAAFAGARFRKGFDIFANSVGLTNLFKYTELIITGEGKWDESSQMGKGSGQIVELARKAEIPVIVICGAIQEHLIPSPHVRDFWVLSQHFSEKDCFENTSDALQKLVKLKLRG